MREGTTRRLRSSSGNPFKGPAGHPQWLPILVLWRSCSVHISVHTQKHQRVEQCRPHPRRAPRSWVVFVRRPFVLVSRVFATSRGSSSSL